ncbi:MAG: glycosyltransferase family 2 protein [Patescibacteria group bacterium]|nr:glycosyltransferase family 2 protein [Patescibacteria group bacterium]MDD5490380.1 glycosyltransferase family 2 protein [Patescibacteria group bacterium]
MDLSIVILNYKTRGFLKTCIRGIEMFNHGLNYEIIVVDNASGDGSAEMIKENFPNVKLIEAPVNLGHAKGNNLGIKEAQGKYILLLNTDIAPLEGGVKNLYDFLEKTPDIGLAGAKLLNPDKTPQQSCLRFPSKLTPLFRRTFLGRWSFAKADISRYVMADFCHDRSCPVEWVMSSAIMVRREAMKKVGLMDERFFVYFADVDWCRRFWENGYKVYYVAEAPMVHYHRRESAENKGLASVFNPLTRIHIKDWIKYLRKYKNSDTPQIYGN